MIRLALVAVIFSFFPLISSAQCPTVGAFVASPVVGCSLPHMVFFTDQSTLPDTWFWDFGDGNTSTLQNPVHTYTSGGTFSVSLTVGDTIVGCSDMATTTINVSVTNADFSGNLQFGCAPLSVDFTDNSSSNGSTLTSWTWDFGDGQTSNLQNPNHVYQTPGIYSVSLTVVDANGCTDTQTFPSYMQVIGPDVNFGADTTFACNSLTVNFTDSTIFGAPIISWDWNFGDGNNSNLQNPTHTYTTVGNFDVSLTVTDIDGCTRTFTQSQYISIFGTALGIDTQFGCSPFLWIDGNTYASSNNSATHLIPQGASTGCDSLVTLDLTIGTPSTGVDAITACDTYTWIDGLTYTSSNSTSTHTLTNASGCDSVVTLNLILNSSTSGIDPVVACDSFTWIDGNTYSASNSTATHILINAAGCDSIVTLNLTINNSTSATEAITACDSYTWIDGITYTSSNTTATHTILNALGCDSLITLDLILNTATTGTDAVTACDSFTWIDGITYTNSNSTAQHVLMNSVGCDSIVTLDLTINSSSTFTDVITACDSYVWIDGNTYTASNTSATHILTNAAGCDSLVTLNLTINSSSTGIDVISECITYTWIDGVTYTVSNNTAVHLLTNAVGCDSIVTLDLTIFPAPNVVQQSFVDVCDQGGIINLIGGSPSGGIYSGVGVSGSTFDPSISGVGAFDITYFYVDGNGCQNSAVQPINVLASPTVSLAPIQDFCNTDAPITLSGGNPSGGIYSGVGIVGGVFDPASVGTGTFIVSYSYTDPNGCVQVANQSFEVNNCANINSLDPIDINLFPNPVRNTFKLTSNTDIKFLALISIDGELVRRFKVNQESYNVADLPSGLYFIHIETMYGDLRYRLIKE